MLVQKTIIPYLTDLSPIEPDWYKISYPYFWHPWKGIIATVNIYLMVAISVERFRAVCYPLSRRHVSISLFRYFLSISVIFLICYIISHYSSNLIYFQSPYKYLIFVIATSVILKLPRFFHLKLIRVDETFEYWTTPMMDDPVYIRFISYWDDLFAT